MAVDGDEKIRLQETWSNHPVMRGPVLAHAGPNGQMTATTVKEDLFDPTKNLRAGSAEIKRTMPLLQSFGDYHLLARDALLYNQRQFGQTRVGTNDGIRIPAIFSSGEDEWSQGYVYDWLRDAYQAYLGPEVNDYLEWYTDMTSGDWNSPKERLAPLDDDHEWNEYHAHFPSAVGAPRDFYPTFEMTPSLSHEKVAQKVKDLIDKIQGRPAEEGRSRVSNVAERAAGQFRTMYRRVIDELEALLDVGEAPPGARAEIDQLQRKIDTLTQFIASQQSGN